jgi:hypothetical protein
VKEHRTVKTHTDDKDQVSLKNLLHVPSQFTHSHFEAHNVLQMGAVMPRRNKGGRSPPNPCEVTRHNCDPMSHLGKPLSGRPLEGLEATKGIGAGRRWAPVALIDGTEPHDHLSLCSSRLLRSLPGRPLLGEASCPLAVAEVVGDQRD